MKYKYAKELIGKYKRVTMVSPTEPETDGYKRITKAYELSNSAAFAIGFKDSEDNLILVPYGKQESEIKDENELDRTNPYIFD